MMFDDSNSGIGGIQANPATIKAAPTTVKSSAIGTGRGLLRETVTVTGMAEKPTIRRMVESQRNEPFEEPPFEEISNISRMHVQAMEMTDADEVWIGAGMKQILLRTVGRKSGNEHKVALPYWEDPNGD